MASLFVELLSAVLLFSLVFGMTATVEITHMQKQVHNSVALLIGASIQFIILPFVGFLTVQAFRLPAEVGIMLLVITSSPGGSYSNWWCSMFNADLALSVTMTALSTILATVMLPANLLLYTRWTYSPAVVKSLDWTALFISLIVVLGGILSGLCVSYYAAKQKANGNNVVEMRRNANRMGNLAGLALILLSFTVSSSHHDAALWDQQASFYAACAFPPMIGLALAVTLASHFKLEKPERVAVSVESCYQNTGIATTVALTMFKTESELASAIGVPLFYGMVEAIVIVSFCLLCWKAGWTKAPANESICKIITTSYEVECIEETEQEVTAIEVVLGRDGIDDGKHHDLIFSKTTAGGDYMVAQESLQHKIETLNMHKSKQPEFGFEIGESEIDPTECSTSFHTNDNCIEEGDGIMKNAAQNQSHRQRRLYGAVDPPESPTLTETTDETSDSHDQQVMKSRLGGGRKTFAGIRAFATGYRPQQPLFHDDDENDVNLHNPPRDTRLPLSSSTDGETITSPSSKEDIQITNTKSTRSEKNISEGTQNVTEKVVKKHRSRRNYETVATVASPTGSCRPDEDEVDTEQCRNNQDDDISL